MDHNKYNLRKGQHVILDAGCFTESEVVIYDFVASTELFALVYSAVETGDIWRVMTCRLSPINKETVL